MTQGLTQGDPSRGESRDERLDRNFAELLQELRVAQTGVQILFAFLLTLVFASGFGLLHGWEITLYVVTVCFAAAAMATLTAPVALHRLLFRRRMKDVVVNAAHVMTVAGLALLALTAVGSLILAVDAATSRSLALTLGGALLVVISVLWLGVPLLLRRTTEVIEDR